VKRDMAKAKHPPGPPMTLRNMRELGVQRLVASCYGIAELAIASALAFGIIWSVERFAKRAVRRHDWRAMHKWFGWRK
jgi:hypothetical protein